MPWKIRIYNVGKSPEMVKVFDSETHLRRDAQFEFDKAALECCAVIAMLRIDSAFEGTELVYEDS